MTTVLYHYAVTSLHKLITKTDLCLWDLILVFGIWSLSLESDPCIWNLILVFGIISGFLLVGVSMSDQFCCLFTCQMFWWLEVFFSSLFDPWLCAVIHSVFFLSLFFVTSLDSQRESWWSLQRRPPAGPNLSPFFVLWRKNMLLPWRNCSLVSYFAHQFIIVSANVAHNIP